MQLHISYIWYDDSTYNYNMWLFGLLNYPVTSVTEKNKPWLVIYMWNACGFQGEDGPRLGDWAFREGGGKVHGS